MTALSTYFQKEVVMEALRTDAAMRPKQAAWKCESNEYVGAMVAGAAPRYVYEASR
jgi:hypothetical protein